MVLNDQVLPPLPRHPRLYEINTRVYWREQGWKSLAQISDAALDDWAAKFDIVWLMGVWMPSAEGRRLAQSHPGLAEEFRRALPDVTPSDVVSSPYAVRDYMVNPTLGGNSALADLRDRMNRRGIRLMLDLVPNHVARDHPWVSAYPDRFIQGTASDLARSPQNYFRAKTSAGAAIFAHGRDPYFDGWQDTVQVDIFSPKMRAAMTDLIDQLSSQCDGLRCDMAMLLLNDVFQKTWRNKAGPPPPVEFWKEAISAVRKKRRDFIFMAEVYWDLEWKLQEIGFDFTYDKKLYDLLREAKPDPVRGHLHADLYFQARSARMIENHDELRAASVFDGSRGKAVAALTYSIPGLRFFHEGQFVGRKVKVPVQLQRRLAETPDRAIATFYEKLLAALSADISRTGDAWILESLPAWDKNFSHLRMFAFWWRLGDHRRLAVVNDAPDPSQTYVRIPDTQASEQIRFRDLLSDRVYDRNAEEVRSRGMYLDMPAFDAHLFQIEAI